MSEDLYQRVFSQLLTGIAITSIDGEIIECNNALAKITGYSVQELQSMSLEELYLDRARLVEDMRELHKEGLKRNLEVHIRAKSGKERILLVSASIARLYDNLDTDAVGNRSSPLCILLSAMDITARSWEWNEITRRNRELAILARIGQALNSFLELPELLQIILDEAVSSINAERGCLMLIDAKTGEWGQAVVNNMEHRNLTEVDDPAWKLSYTIIEDVLNSGKPVLTVNAKEDPKFSGVTSVVGYGLRSVLCVPLRRAERSLGVLYADNRVKVGEFSLEDLGLLKTIANQAVTAIENVRLYEDERARGMQLAAIVEEQEQRLQELTAQLEATVNVPLGH